MKTERIMLGEHTDKFETGAWLDCCFLEHSEDYSRVKRPLIVIFPGGGYYYTSDREAEPIARIFMARGYHTAILRYSCNVTHPEPLGNLVLRESALAVQLLRERAEEYNIEKDNIGIIGFSAGGHAAAAFATMYQSDAVKEVGISPERCRPNALMLSYPVITGDKRYTHEGSFMYLLGNDIPDEEREFWSLENRVTSDCPPTFIWSTANDNCVPIMNSILFTSALAKNGIPFESHIFPDGVHGLSTALADVYCEELPYINRWTDLCLKWLKTLFVF